MLRQSLIIAFALAWANQFALALDPLKEGSLSAESDGTTIIISWMSADETNVTSFEVERKAGISGQFFLLGAVSPRGNNTTYEYVDDTAFRIGAESVYEYRVKVLFRDGSSVYSEEITVIHAVSSVRRTWGSIKAMFR